MATVFSAWSAETSFAAGHVFLPSAAPDGSGNIDIAYAATTSTSANEPWNVTLNHFAIDTFGDQIYAPATVASYTVPSPATDGVAFPFSYVSFELADNSNATIWTEAIGTYKTNDTSEVEFQRYDDSGAAVGSPVALTLGSSVIVKDLVDIGYSSAADFGNSFMIAYSTYNPSSMVAKISFEEVSSTGTAIKTGTLFSGTEPSGRDISFGGWIKPGEGDPSYVLMYENGVGSVHVQLVNPDGTAGAFDFDQTVLGPDGETAVNIHNFNFLRPDAASVSSDYGVITETFGYQDSHGTDHLESEIETLNASGTVTGHVYLSVSSNESVRVAHLTNGDLVVGYDSGGTTHLAEYSSSLVQIGATFDLPDSTGDISDLVALGDGRVEAFWRQDNTATDGTLHSLIVDTRTSGETVNDSGADGSRDIAGTTFADTITGGKFADHIEGNTGDDVISGGKGNDTIAGGADADTLTGGAGGDTFVYTAVADSQGAAYDTITDLDFSSDKFDVMTKVKHIDTEVTGGTLAASKFESDLTHALKGHLLKHDAVLFAPDKGSLAGDVFLIIDQNGKPGYQAGGDLVIDVTGATGALNGHDFITG